MLVVLHRVLPVSRTGRQKIEGLLSGMARYLEVNISNLSANIKATEILPELKGIMEVTGVNGNASSTVSTLGLERATPFV